MPKDVQLNCRICEDAANQNNKLKTVMTELTLFIDPYDTEYPGPVRELLTQSLRLLNISASITFDNQCLFLCNNVLYIFANKDKGIPNAFKLNLPSTGLLYTASSVCIFKNPNSISTRPSVIVVSPEGVVRYWSDASKPYQDKCLNLNNEVAFSICQIEFLDHVHRFLISTTTAATFYVIEIFYNNYEPSENFTFQTLEMNSPAGIGRRMSMLLFGSFSGEKELVLKTVFARGLIRSLNVDIIAILPKTLRFFSMSKQTLLHEINIVELFITQSQDRQIVAQNASIVDADIYQRGILMLIAVTSSKDRFIKVDFYIGFIKEKTSEPNQYISSFLPIILPESICQMEISKLLTCKLFVTNFDECIIILPKSIISMKNPNADDVDAVVLDSIDDVLLGAAVIDNLCHIVLKDHGICVLRRLPQHFDLKFWKKYRQSLLQLNDGLFSHDNFKKAFLSFCSKDLNEAKELIESIKQKQDLNIAELAVEMDKYFIDCKPNNIRWELDDSSFSEEQIAWLRAQTEISKNFQLVFEQLSDKLSYHNMLVLFLQQFNLLDKIDSPIHSYHSRTGTVVLAEYGEKLILMTLCIGWLAKQQNSLPPLILNAIKSLGQEFTRRFSHPDTSNLTSFDHVFNEVSHFGELISTVVGISEKALKNANGRRDECISVIEQVGAFLSVMAEGIDKAKKEEKILIVPVGTSNWLNDNLIYFIRHLKFAFDFLEDNRDLANFEDHYSLILMHNLGIAKFVLSQQERCRRENSHIIKNFLKIGQVDIALDLAKNFHDFTMLIEYCHKNLSENDCRDTLDDYKKQFEKDDFDLFLYDYYRKKGMVNYLLAEKGNRLNKFLAEHENINWIKNIDNGEYAKIELSLCKLCVLCDSKIDVSELAELSDSIRILTEKLYQKPIENTIY